MNPHQPLDAWLASQPEWVRETYYTNGWVHRAIDNAFSLGHSDAVLYRHIAHIALNESKHRAERIVELESIAPKRIVNNLGDTYVWHCPDHLIPETTP